MNETQGKTWFRIFLITVVITFYIVRPLNSPWSPFIAGDGLSYYSFLPAEFIYGDHNHKYKWFTKAHNDNYVYSAFPNPEDNLLVGYQGRKINKTYPGMSFLWMPFFFMGHGLALITDYPEDGFSAPYQWSVGLASLVYLLLGLWLLRKLILALTRNVLASVLSPVLIFFGTYLYQYGMLANSMSHVYSFALLNMFLYFSWKYFNTDERRLTTFLLASVAFALAVIVRPFTGLILFALPAFIPRGYKWKWPFPDRFRIVDALLLLLIATSIFYTFRLLYVQTGTLFPYTYTDEGFNLGKARLMEALFGYHLGIFIYAPVLLFSLGGLFYMSWRQRIFLSLVFAAVIYLYSAWWYWPIIKRSLLDFYQLPAIFLAFLIAGTKGNGKRGIIVFSVLLALYFQFKNYQFRKGILDENSTYSDVFWKNFFRLRKTTQYPVNPAHIKSKVEFREGFEGDFSCKTTTVKKTEGERSLLLDSVNYICKLGEFKVPDIFGEKGYAKIRCSFKIFTEPGVNSMHAFINIKDTAGKVIKEPPLYLSKEDLWIGHWDEKEFGYEITKEDMADFKKLGTISFFAWNVESKSTMYIDDVKFEFILTSVSLETIE